MRPPREGVLRTFTASATTLSRSCDEVEFSDGVTAFGFTRGNARRRRSPYDCARLRHRRKPINFEVPFKPAPRLRSLTMLTVSYRPGC